MWASQCCESYYNNIVWFRPPAFQGTNHICRSSCGSSLNDWYKEKWNKNELVLIFLISFFATNVSVYSSGGANNILWGELCESSFQHHEELPVHGCQPAALQTGKNSCTCAWMCVCVSEFLFTSMNYFFQHTVISEIWPYKMLWYLPLCITTEH